MQGKEYRKYIIEDYNKVIKLKQKGVSKRRIASILKINEQEFCGL